MFWHQSSLSSYFFFFFFFNSVLCPFQDYFSSYEMGQSVGGAKTGEPREKPPDTPASRTCHRICSPFSNISKATWPIKTKLHVEHPRGGGTEVDKCINCRDVNQSSDFGSRTEVRIQILASGRSLKNQNVQYLGKFPLIYDKNTQYLLSRRGKKVFTTNF